MITPQPKLTAAPTSTRIAPSSARRRRSFSETLNCLYRRAKIGRISKPYHSMATKGMRPESPLLAAVTLASALATLGTPVASHAAGPGATVQGVVIPPAKVEAPPPPRMGFVDRIENPIVELRQHDPLPECF